MSLGLIVTLNLIAVAGLLGLLAYTMSRAARLRPHIHEAAARVVELDFTRHDERESRRAA